MIIVGAVIGFITGGPFGALLGAGIGFWIKNKFANNAANFSSQQKQQTQTAFFRATFLVMGRVAKADGLVSEQEIDNARKIMTHLRLSTMQRKMAIDLFNQGKQPSSDIESALLEFRNSPGAATLIPMFLEIQLSAAYADGPFTQAEHAVFKDVCRVLGVNNLLFTQIHKRFQAQHAYYTQGGGQSHNSGYQQHQQYRRASSGISLRRAYGILGVSETASDAEVKKAWRKLMSENHPDKLLAKGLPEEMMAVAKEKTQEIQGAYDEIRRARKMGK